MARNDQSLGLEEGVQRSFALDDPIAFRRLMLELYGDRCAVTGSDSAGEALEVFLFQPLGHDGPLTTGNAMVVEQAVASLLRRGLILISDDYLAFTPHPEVIGLPSDPDTLRGRNLFLPDDAALWPERSMLAYHRSLFRAQ